MYIILCNINSFKWYTLGLAFGFPISQYCDNSCYWIWQYTVWYNSSVCVIAENIATVNIWWAHKPLSHNNCKLLLIIRDSYLLTTWRKNLCQLKKSLSQWRNGTIFSMYMGRHINKNRTHVRSADDRHINKNKVIRIHFLLEFCYVTDIK